MGFRLVPKSVSLNDLERRNGRVVCLISPNSLAFGTSYYVKLLEESPILKCSPNNLVLAIYHLWRYLQGIAPARTLK